jgi:quercetin dioxygenase-like cupin family protein
MRNVLRIAGVGLVACACSAPAEEAPIEIAAAEASEEQVTRRVPQFENEHVEVWKSIILPNQPLSMHRHDHPRAIIALKGGTLTVTNDAGESHEMTWETGSAYWLDADPPGEMHGDVNEGAEPVEVIVVQLKGAS